MTKKKQGTVDFGTGEILSSHWDHVVFPVIRTHANAHLLPKHKEVPTMPSNTIPDQSLPLRTILDRYTRGLPLDVPMTANMYEGESDIDMPDLRTLDLADQQELMERMRENTKALEKRLQEQARERRKAQIKKLQDEQKKQQQSNGQNPENKVSEPSPGNQSSPVSPIS